MKKKYNYICCLCVLLFYACVSDLPFGGEYDGIPTVNCMLKNDSVQTLSLTRAVKISDSYIFKEIQDAEIFLSDDDSIVGHFIRTGYGNWQLRYRPVSGQEYHLKVLLADGTELTASTTMPYWTYILPDMAKDKYPSKHFVQYTADLPCWVMIIASDSLLLGASRPTRNDRLRLYIGTDHPNVDRFNEDENLLSKISLADTPAFLYYIRIKADSQIEEQGIPFRLQTNYEYSTFVCFQTASEEYDKYMKTSFDKILMRLGETDPGIWFDETIVYSNIHNGTGIFAAYYEHFFNYNHGNSFSGF